MNKLLKLTLLAVSLFTGKSNAYQNISSILSNYTAAPYTADPISSYAPNLQTLMNEINVIKDNVNMMSKAKKYLIDVETKVFSHRDDADLLYKSNKYTYEEKIGLLQYKSSILNSIKIEMTSVLDNIINICDPRTTMYNGQVLYKDGIGVTSNDCFSYLYLYKYNLLINSLNTRTETIDITLEYLEGVKNLCDKFKCILLENYWHSI